MPLGISLVVQWLNWVLPMQGVWIWPLVRELRFHMLCSAAKEKKEKENQQPQPKKKKKPTKS